MSGLEGTCPKCGAIHRGWALKSPWYQTCDRLSQGGNLVRHFAAGIIYRGHWLEYPGLSLN